MARKAQEQTQPKTDAKGRIPHFKNIEEEAAFWDSHDLSEFEDELEEVTDVQFVVRRVPTNKAITVRVDEKTLATLTDQARQRGIGPSTLVRMWILERLRGERRSARRSP